MGLLEGGQGEVRGGLGVRGQEARREGLLTGSGEDWEGCGGCAEGREGLA